MNGRGGYILGSTVLLILWQFVAWLAGDAVVAGPGTVLVKLTQEAGTEVFWRHLGTSLFRMIAALLISLVTAVPLGLFLGSNPKADRIAKPLIYLTYPVPKIVLLPLVLLVCGLGDLGKIAMLWLILFFQLLIPTRDAAAAVSTEAKYSLYSLGGTGRHLFMHVIWPACLPGVFTALRITTGTVVAVLFFVESIAARHGMGFYILDAWGRGDVPQIFTGMVVLALIGVALYETCDLLERLFCPWKRIDSDLSVRE